MYSVATTAANVADITQVPQLLHGAETRVGGAIDWQKALRRGQRKASIRAKVVHPFPYVKQHFGHGQVRYRGLAKNPTRLCL